MEELNVELIGESEGTYECALYDEEGNEKHTFTLELSDNTLKEMTEDILFMDEILQDTLEKNLKNEVIRLIFEKCEEFNASINYYNLSLYDNMAAGEIVSSLSGWMEQRVYDYFNDIYKLNDEQLEELKRFYKQGIDLNLVIKRSTKTSILESEMLSAKEMKDIRISKETEWKNMRKNNAFKDSLKVDTVAMPKDEKTSNGISTDFSLEIEDF